MHATEQRAAKHADSLRLLSYNIQGGIETRAYHHYLVRSWQHVLPHSTKRENLDEVARFVHDYDIVGLQETDAGSWRSGFTNLTEYLAKQARFPYWYNQVNRNIGKIAQHSNGLLCRVKPLEVVEHKLPGLIPGRGALLARFELAGKELVVVVAHLSLGRQTRIKQIGFISEVLGNEKHVVLMGDLNCETHSKEMEELFRKTHLQEPGQAMHTFPSWKPKRNIDHILVSSSVNVSKFDVINYGVSDHLPVAMTMSLKTQR